MPESLYVDGLLRAFSYPAEYVYVDGALHAMDSGEPPSLPRAINEDVTVTEFAQRFAAIGGIEAAEIVVSDDVTASDHILNELPVTLFDDVTVTDAPALFALFIAETGDDVVVTDGVSASLGNLAVHGADTISVTDWVRLRTPNLTMNLYDLVAVTEGPMNLNAEGIGPTPTPPPGSTLQDYWVVGIV